MTIKDRAEKMIDTLAFNRKWDRKTRIRYYVAEMEEAVKEAIAEFKADHALCDDGYPHHYDDHGSDCAKCGC